MRKIIFTAAALMALALGSCDKGNKYTVNGEIDGAKDSLLYFENMSLTGPVTVDSVKLDADGKFSFSDNIGNAPEFYRLRIGNQIINLAADSVETVTVKAEYATMPTAYTVEGSDDCKRIKELALKQIDLHKRAVALENNRDLAREKALDSLMRMTDEYKTYVKTHYIFKDPKAASSYFALFQTLGNYLIFNPRTNSDDIRVFAAVATAWDTYYPEAERGKNLHNIAIEGMKNERIAAANRDKEISPDKIITTGIIDIKLPDNTGTTHTLTELKGNVVLLDFHVFGMENSPKRILMLRELYNKYHNRGLEIYQVSVDADEHFWKQQTAALPWICVYDESSLSSRYLSLYNISNLPEYFLIDRANNLVKRSEQMDDLEKEIEKLL
ncbi:MAG: DUF4369 domain-containing protein [Prevotella sp.]|nr:DUF4369 domain-containing protein [Prevotella sp.]